MTDHLSSMPAWIERLTVPARKRVVGLDLSLTGTGVATEYGETVITTSQYQDPYRCIYICDRIMYHIHRDCPLVVVEGPSYGSSNTPGTAAQFGLRMMVLARLWQSRRRVVEIPPRSLKKWATGNGNAEKDLMVKTASKESQRPIERGDEADAYWLRHIGLSIANSVTSYGESDPKETKTLEDLQCWRRIRTDQYRNQITR